MMSTILGDSTDPLTVLKSPELLAAAILAMAIAAVAGALRRGSIRGPKRLSPGESPGQLLAPLGLALTGWALTVLAIGGWSQTHNANPSKPPHLSPPAEIVFNGLLNVVVFTILITASLATRPEGITRLGIGLNRLPFGVAGGLIAIIVVMPLMYYVNGVTDFVLDKFHVHYEAHDFLVILKDTTNAWLRIAIVVVAGLIAPIAEETFFRGFLQTIFRYSLNNPWVAVFLSAAMFAFIHPYYTWPQIFFLAVCMGYLYERTGNLWANITLHSLFNLTSIVVYWRFER